MPAPWLTRQPKIRSRGRALALPATAILGVGLALGTAAPAVAQPAPVAKVIARGEREAVTDPAPDMRDPLLLLAALGLAIGAGGALAVRRLRVE
jgi:hypothetical protein